MLSSKLSENESIFLDFIRATASQLVLIGHAISYFSIATYLHHPHFPWMQNIAVVLFFILSGFVITYSTRIKYKKGGYLFSDYFVDRFSRIYSAFIPALFFIIIIDFVSQSIDPVKYIYTNAFNVRTFLANVFMIQDFPIIFNYTSFGSARPFWTIAIEWWLYLTFGCAYFLFIKSSSFEIKNILLILLVSIVPVYNLIGGRGEALSLYWVFGMCASLTLPYYKKMPINVCWKIIFAIALLSLAILRQVIIRTAYDVTFALILTLLMLVLLDLINKIRIKHHVSSIIGFFASYSFTLYLVHYSILDFVKLHFSNYHPYLLFIISFLISNFVAFLIGRLTEYKLKNVIKVKMNGSIKVYKNRT